MKLACMLATTLVLTWPCFAHGDPYELGSVWVDVDYWAGSGPNETIIVIDWNQTNGPYETEAHAWGYRWSGTEYLSQALTEVCAAGALNVTTSGGGAFISDAYYFDPLIDDDSHSSAGYSGYWWLGGTADGGQAWDLNPGGMTTEMLGHNFIEGLNMDSGDWTSETMTIPVPEPSSLVLLVLGAVLTRRKKR